MKSLIIWDQIGEAPLQFAILEGDFSDVHYCYVNECGLTEVQEAMLEYIKELVEQVGTEEFPLADLQRDTEITQVVICGFYHRRQT